MKKKTKVILTMSAIALSIPLLFVSANIMKLDDKTEKPITNSLPEEFSPETADLMPNESIYLGELCREIHYEKDIDLVVFDKCIKPGKMIISDWKNFYVDATKQDIAEYGADGFIKKKMGDNNFDFFLSAKINDDLYRLYYSETRGIFFW